VSGEFEGRFPDAYATVVELRTRAGRTLTRRNDIARGYPETPISRAKIEAKFEALASSVASSARVRALRKAIASEIGSP
jgi:2-methylcitrate dehydratase PrpD